MLRTFADLDALADAAAEAFAELAREAVAARGVFHVALSGGSTPRAFHGKLAARGRAALPWDQIVLWWGDERTVPPEHPDSNFGMAKQTLVDPLKLTRMHRMHGEDDPVAAAAAYEHTLVRELGTPPVIDLVLLGMGPDGHCASLFPGTTGLDAPGWVCANPVDSPVAKGKTVRLTFTARAINSARHVRFVVAGADKADAFAHVMEGPREPHRYPSQLIAGTDVQWLVEHAVAAKLGGKS